MKDPLSRKTNASDLLIGGVLGSVFTSIIGLFVSHVLIAEIIWGFAFIFIIFLLFSQNQSE